MTNQEFCYWLQGYFEISKKIVLTKEKILKIKEKLDIINEPLGEFTTWLLDVLLFLAEEDYRQGLVDYFLHIIRNQLNLIFYHVIDNSYETDISLETSINIHDGIATNDKQ